MPVSLNSQIVLSWFQRHIDKRISIAVHHIVDVFVEVSGSAINVEQDSPDKSVPVVNVVSTMIRLSQADGAFCLSRHIYVDSLEASGLCMIGTCFVAER